MSSDEEQLRVPAGSTTKRGRGGNFGEKWTGYGRFLSPSERPSLLSSPRHGHALEADSRRLVLAAALEKV